MMVIPLRPTLAQSHEGDAAGAQLAERRVGGELGVEAQQAGSGAWRWRPASNRSREPSEWNADSVSVPGQRAAHTSSSRPSSAIAGGSR